MPVLNAVSSLAGPFDAARALQQDVDAQRWRGRLAQRLFGVPSEGVLIGGRYRLGERIGEGGMGVVYRARDTQLRRDVAVKLMRSERTVRRAKLRDEAQALARLSHPNVVAAFDVGQTAGQVFIAMELVSGANLRQWLAARERSVDAILDAVLAAGRGLIAAHEAGLVHRDFKPDNVLVGDDGRTRVLDFGLAAEVPTSATASGDTAELPPPATHIVGTPLYMPAEVRRGAVADALADQFAFCVTLREALDGRHPFAANPCRSPHDDRDPSAASALAVAPRRTRGDLRPLARPGRPQRGTRRPAFARQDHALALRCILDGDIAAPPEGSRCPKWLVPLLDRGLAHDRSRRWPSMEALLDAIEAGRRRRFPKWWIALGLGGLGVGAALAGAAESPVPCDVSPVTWSRDALREAILADDAAYAGDSWRLAESRLDAWSDDWAAAQRRACEADRPAATTCLRHAMREQTAMVDSLTRSADAARTATTALAGLPDPQGCLDLDPAGAAPRERDPAILASEASVAAGDYAAAMVSARDAVRRADDRGRAPALFQLASVQELVDEHEAAADNLERASWLAAAAGDDHTAAEAATSLVFVLGDRLARMHDAEAWVGHARAALARLDDAEAIEARLASNIGMLRMAQGRAPEAKRAYAEALDHARAAFGADDPATATAAHNYGMALFALGEFDEAELLYREVIEIRETTLGPKHPLTASSRLILGPVLHRLGRYDEARAEVEAAAELSEAALGATHRQTAAAKINLAVMLQQRGEAERAAVLFEDALAALRSIHGDAHTAVADAEDGLGSALRSLGRIDEAREHMVAALAILRALLPAGSPRLGSSLGNLASLHYDAGEYTEARDRYAEAFDVFAQTLDETHPFYAFALQGRGKSRWRVGEVDEGQTDLERAIAIHREAGKEPRRLAEARFALAELLWNTNRDRTRAVALARAAIDEVAAVPDADPAQRQAWERWLSERAND